MTEWHEILTLYYIRPFSIPEQHIPILPVLTDKCVSDGFTSSVQHPESQKKSDSESKSPIGSIIKPEGDEPDYLYDDTALVYKSPQGLVIITGCSHSGICNIVEQAKKLCREERVMDIVGGLHLLDSSEEQLRGTLEYMKKLNPKQMHACHCTDLNSKIALSKVVNLKEVGVGLVLEYE